MTENFLVKFEVKNNTRDIEIEINTTNKNENLPNKPQDFLNLTEKIEQYFIDLQHIEELEKLLKFYDQKLIDYENGRKLDPIDEKINGNVQEAKLSTFIKDKNRLDQCLKKIKEFPNISSIDLSCNTLKDTECSLIFSHLSKNLSIKSLNLSHNEIGDKGIDIFAEIFTVQNSLEILNVSDNKITDSSFRKLLVTLGKNEGKTKLKELNWENNNISEKTKELLKRWFSLIKK